MSSRDDMSRVTLRAEPDGDDTLAAIYAHVTREAGGVPRLYQALGAAPHLLQGWIDFAWALRDDARSSRALRELAVLRCAQLCGSDYVWRSHILLAVRAGVSEAKVAALASAGGVDAAFEPVELAVLALTAELVDGAVSDATWHAAAAYLDEQMMVELVLTVSWYIHVARVVAALDIPLEGYHAAVPPLSEPGPRGGSSCARS
ncbi:MULTISPECIES: carboxymuconolactone decarboxylase family protein [Nocardia]|uniref:carboxymuconolactone decarboxylase family protein n=1 Tax=Nocardia TaxID=1817 RepID=UPI001300BB72|nr:MULTISPECIES: carboxymuconolactone decarboxylase family protein [Nocardia]